ncbi:MAG: isoprenyl transferase [Clostridiales bacterium]|nr:isoprenyl transferase [Clostridiales bacterium]
MFFKKKLLIDETKFDMERIPKHIAIIMDGNGRWAKKRMLPRKAGHKAGATALENLSDYANALGVKHMTVYAFSTENWKRSEEEVEAIMDLLRAYLQTYIDKAGRDNMRIDVIGDRQRLAPDIQEKIRRLETITKDQTGLFLHIALNYGGRDEILRAVKKIAQQVKNGDLAPIEIEEETISNVLDTAHVPDPDLLIRTSGEERISNFMLWQLAYSEFYFTDKLWPDFKNEDLDEAILQFQMRDRRFGGRKS